MKNKFGLENFVILDPNDDMIFDAGKMNLGFTNVLSFHKLIEHIETVSKCDDRIKSSFAQSILDEYKKTPELHDAIYDMSVLKDHTGLVDNMMMFVLPSAFYDKQIYAASSTFMTEIFYASTKFSEIIKIDNGIIEGESNLDTASFNFGKYLSAFVAILRRYYGIEINFDFPLVYKIPDPVTGLDRYFKMNMANEFMDVKLKGTLRHLTQKDLDKIRVNIYDLRFLAELLPPENFEFTGFMVMNAINITTTEILSAIKRDLIEKDTITSISGFLKLQHKLQSLLKCPGLLLGLADYPGSTNKLFEYGHKIGNSFLMNENCIKKLSTIKDSIYDYAFETKRAVIIEDLEKSPDNTKLEQEILKQGIKNILVAPLFYNNEIVGILELGSPSANMINKVNSLVLREVFPIFAMAVARGKDEMNNKIEAIIKEKCTAIHPTLEWRFRNAARNLLKKDSADGQDEMEEIVFHDVYPLYGLTDVRNSSLQRNDAIRSDLVENLVLARDVFSGARKIKKLKILEEIIYKIDKRIDSLKFGISSADEAETIRFLNKKIIPHFEHLENYGTGVKDLIIKYHSSVDPMLGFIYKKRKDFEESVSMINDMVAGLIDEEQELVQELYPHYFERFKTDGVDHNIYIGSSLVEKGNFDRIYLKNLRLWQLMFMCRIVKRSASLKDEMLMPIETAHLILVQDTPLSIRFRFDEKKFDVDGAYNIRYEIMKKRIDKAEIKGREERLTQPGKIAIVFSQDTEAQEYLEYIEYLQANKYLTREIEELDIEDLQGIKGLRALRVTVDQDSKSLDEKINMEKVLSIN